MASTTFTNNVTLTDAAWFQDVNTVAYTIFGDGSSYTGNITLNTNKFTVAYASGNTVIAGTASIAGTLTAAAINASGNGSFGPGGSGSAQTTITANGSSANTYGPGIYLQRNSVSKGVFATESQLAGNNSDNIWLYAYAGASLKLYGGGNLGQTIDASGNVTMPGTLGVTGAITTTDGRLSITNTSSASSFTSSAANADVLSFTHNTGTASQQYGHSTYLAGDPNNTTNYFFNCVGTATSRIVGRSNGGIANFSANNVNLSDIRTKKDIQPAGEYLSKIMAIPVKTFLYKDQTDTDLNLGVIAQDVEAVAPELVDVSGFGKTPEDGIPLKTIYQTDLQYALMKALQELATDFQAYKAAHP